ncbi:MAG: 23S rRNA (uracil(1939)-C(5))-methyltransferase RlmD [Bacteroidales bacterium]|nr:23S rRNA (uracil(1939)-C(5))-methyltransferase RlmD [Bacteroidales bacterium]
MSNKKKNTKLIEKVLITDIADEGKAVAKSEEGPVVFVNNAVPGDIVDIQVRKKRKKYYEGQVVAWHSYSELRQEPFCSHFGVCGGCKWQYMKYEAQLKFKQNRVAANLTRIGKAPAENILDIVPSSNTTYYRNKLEFTFSNKRWLTQQEIQSGHDFDDRNALGFHIPRMFDKVLDIEKCYLQKDPSNTIRLALKQWAIDHELSFYDIREKQGLLRNLIIRTSSIGELMLIVCFFRNDEQEIEGVMSFLKKQFPEITSLMYVVNQKANDTIDDQDIILFSGRDHIFEELDGLRYKIGPKSFFQTNTEQGLNLYEITRNYAGLTGTEIVYDLYTGTGTIANFIARYAKKVIGIEYVPEAIEDAKTNSELNGITNTSFFAGDMKDILSEKFINEQGKPDVVILDPPRAGVHKDVIDALIYCDAERIVYVSCNPATQARDIALLSERYKMAKAQPVDMFPHTDHVENVVLLEKF